MPCFRNQRSVYRGILPPSILYSDIIIGNQLLNLQSRSVCSVLISYFLFVLTVAVTDRPKQAWQFCNACHLIKYLICLLWYVIDMHLPLCMCNWSICYYKCMYSASKVPFHYGIPAMIFRTEMLQQLQVVEALSPT